MRINRIPFLTKLEELRKSQVIVYVTSDRQNAETNIGADILPFFANQLDEIGDVEKISLFIYSNGGSTLAGWSLVNLIRSFCKDFEVIIPSKCQSTATLISLGSDRIVMTKQATLGPIDPSTNGVMNPQVNVNGQMMRAPVSVEHVNGFLDMAKEDLGIRDQKELKDIYMKLSDHIHPLALGDVYKAKSQIKMLAEKLLKYHTIDPENVSKVISFLCSESDSHDYTIYRREAKDELGLNIEKPNDELYSVIKAIYQDIETELDLRNPFNPMIIAATQNGNYILRRALIESIKGGTDAFVSEGVVRAIQAGPGQMAIQDNRQFEGWRHEN
jgi:hypothetical protein